MICPFNLGFYDQKSIHEGSFNPGGFSLGWCLEESQGWEMLIAREEMDAGEK